MQGKLWSLVKINDPYFRKALAVRLMYYGL
jgi:hypothetical protein